MNTQRIEALVAALRQRRRRRGMTLMEVMIVLAIIILLMGVLTYGLQSMFSGAQADTARIQIQQIDQRISLYKIKKKKLPDSLSDLYKDEPVPRDPWGNEYVFRSGGGKNGYDIISYGADGHEGGTGKDADIKLGEDD
ncbi:MAG TPA: type II secretion system protein GspG [Myxococcota bacterium]|nr:type II secretion system protein GspG [Myxococcota bacterium]